jgi:hypothetical protein
MKAWLASTLHRAAPRVRGATALCVTIFVPAVLAGCGGGDAENFSPLPPPATTVGEAGTTLVPNLPNPPPEPVVATGRGSTRTTIRLAEGPAIVAASFVGAGRVRAELAAGPRLDIMLFRGAAPLEAERAVWWLEADRYSLAVRAIGSWRLVFESWRPRETDRALEGVFTGTGGTVIPVRVGSEAPASVVVDYTAHAAFSLRLLPFTQYGQEITVSDRRRGPVHSRFPISVPDGDYLMQVEAGGSWRLAFAP